MLEGLETLAHPSLAALYPTLTDRLGVLFDVWGLSDRDVVGRTM